MLARDLLGVGMDHDRLGPGNFLGVTPLNDSFNLPTMTMDSHRAQLALTSISLPTIDAARSLPGTQLKCDRQDGTAGLVQRLSARDGQRHEGCEVGGYKGRQQASALFAMCRGTPPPQLY